MTEVRRAEELSRYELLLVGAVVGRADYLLAEGVLTLTHVETDPALAGQGLASALVAGALADIRARGLRVVPQCSFAAAYLARNPQWQDLLAPDGRVPQGSERVRQIT